MNNVDIVFDLAESESEETLNEIKSLNELNLSSLHRTFGEYIRNKYGLWNREWIPEIRDGVDYSESHPDNVSNLIIALLHFYLNNKSLITPTSDFDFNGFIDKVTLNPVEIKLMHEFSRYMSDKDQIRIISSSSSGIGISTYIIYKNMAYNITGYTSW